MIDLLEQQITAVESHYPDIGNRAQQAAGLVTGGAVMIPDKGPAGYMSGYWRVSDKFTVNIETGSCTCGDLGAPRGERPGKNPTRLCAHMLACMFVRRLHAGAGNQLLTIMRMGRQSGAEFKIRINVIFGSPEMWTVTGYQIAGAGWVDMGPGEQLRLDPREFDGLSRIAGVDMARMRDRTHVGSIAFIYPMIATDSPDNLRAAHQPAAVDAELRTDRKRQELIAVTSDL